ncbi:clathrin light chain B-like isoform 2-T2 [Molossus nigricans]
MGLATDLNKALPLGKRKTWRQKPASQKGKEILCLRTSQTTYATWWRTLGRTKRASEEAFVKESKEETPGTEWEKVAQLCDFNPKSSKQCKDVSRLRSVLMSLKQTPLSR